MFDLTGKRIYLTGDQGQLGRVWRRALEGAGASVYGLDATGPVPVDVTDEAAVRQYVAGLPAADGIIIAAAIDAPPSAVGQGPFGSLDWDVWRRIVDVNLTGAAICASVVGQQMADSGRGGSIVFVGSMYGLVGPDPRRYDAPFVKPAAYSASKAGLVGLTKYLAAYWGPSGVRVNCVCFGALDRSDYSPHFRAEMERAIPLGRMAKASEWTGILQFLVSDAASYITGAVVPVDGGVTAI